MNILMNRLNKLRLCPRFSLFMRSAFFQIIYLKPNILTCASKGRMAVVRHADKMGSLPIEVGLGGFGAAFGCC